MVSRVGLAGSSGWVRAARLGWGEGPDPSPTSRLTAKGAGIHFNAKAGLEGFHVPCLPKGLLQCICR
jgi:hypothetical protein